MSDHRDRVEMQFVVDEHVKAVLEFMWRRVPAAKVVSVAEAIPQLTRLLWGENPQEPVSAISLQVDPAIKREAQNQSRSVSIGSSLGSVCVGDGSAEEAASR
jgi:uncharacterized protein (DUF2267 family)